MANKRFRWLMLILALAFSMTGCPNDTDRSKDDEPPAETFPEAKGKITITNINGLHSDTDYYMLAIGHLGYASDGRYRYVGITDVIGYNPVEGYKLAKISGRKAEVPLYENNPDATSYGNAYLPYEGNDTLIIHLTIRLTGIWKTGESVFATKKFTGTFSNGNLTVNWLDL